MYVAAIEAMSKWSHFGWNSPVIDSQLVELPGEPGVSVIYSGSTPESQSPPKLSHILLGLYQGILEIIGQDSSYELFITLWFQGHPEGLVSLEMQSASSQNPGGGSVTDGTLQGTKINNILNADSGQINDPTHPYWVINWKFDGALVDPVQTLAAVTDALITAASHESREICPLIYGVSLDGGIVISIEYTPDPRARAIMDYRVVTAILPLMTTRIFLLNSKFAELKFDVEVRGAKIGAGSVMKAGNALSNGTLGKAT